MQRRRRRAARPQANAIPRRTSPPYKRRGPTLAAAGLRFHPFGAWSPKRGRAGARNGVPARPTAVRPASGHRSREMLRPVLCPAWWLVTPVNPARLVARRGRPENAFMTKTPPPPPIKAPGSDYLGGGTAARVIRGPEPESGRRARTKIVRLEIAAARRGLEMAQRLLDRPPFDVSGRGWLQRLNAARPEPRRSFRKFFGGRPSWCGAGKFPSAPNGHEPHPQRGDRFSRLGRVPLPPA